MPALEPSNYVHENVIPVLASLTLAKLRQSLAESVPERCLDSSVGDYELTNLRYEPNRRMVLGLSSPLGQKPLSVCVFPPREFARRWETASLAQAGHAYELSGLHAIAWTFPRDRKLDLSIVADSAKLHGLIERSRGYEPEVIVQVHYVPEHTYTARVLGDIHDKQNCDYLKIYYNDNGARTARIMEELAGQLDENSFIEISRRIHYIDEHKLLIQDALPVAGRDRDFADEARALAEFHSLDSRHAPRQQEGHDAQSLRARGVLAAVFPSALGWFDDLLERLSGMDVAARENETVLLHGDAHYGNLLGLSDGGVGIIDLDQCARGPAVRDLATYFAFKLWVELRMEKGMDKRVDKRADKRSDDGSEQVKVNGLCGTVHEMGTFLDAYNRWAKRAVEFTPLLQEVVRLLVVERVRRSIVRGKIRSESALHQLLELGERTLALQ